jgi:hypothetical protein
MWSVVDEPLLTRLQWIHRLGTRLDSTRFDLLDSRLQNIQSSRSLSLCYLIKSVKELAYGIDSSVPPSIPHEFVRANTISSLLSAVPYIRISNLRTHWKTRIITHEPHVWFDFADPWTDQVQPKQKIQRRRRCSSRWGIAGQDFHFLFK